jgi:hypothetical protein
VTWHAGSCVRVLKRLIYKADNLTATVSRLSRKCGSHDVSQPCGPQRPVKKIEFVEVDGILICKI